MVNGGRPQISKFFQQTIQKAREHIVFAGFLIFVFPFIFNSLHFQPFTLQSRLLIRGSTPIFLLIILCNAITH
jgi:hypothetical protein